MESFDHFMLDETPYFIAQKYRQVIEADSSENKVRYGLQLYELALRTLSIGLILQYLIRDAAAFSFRELNELIEERLLTATLRIWEEILFSALRVYCGKRDRLFIEELHDFYIDESVSPPRERSDKRSPFSRLTQIDADIRDVGRDPENIVDWEKVWHEMYPLLVAVFSHFAFIRKYEIVRPIQETDDGYQYQLYVGEIPSVASNSIKTTDELRLNHLYLRKAGIVDNPDMLDLYPLLVLLDVLPKDLASETIVEDVGLYERYAQSELYYLIAEPWRKVPYETSLGDFVDLVFSVIRSVKHENAHSSERLSWPYFVELAQRVNKRRMASIAGKYQPELYLQREQTAEIFEQFLESDKRGFILVGKSGVGKSSFLLSLAETYARERPGLCFLMYDAAKLNPNEAINAAILRDFDQYIKLTHRKVAAEDGVWQLVDEIDRVHRGQVVLCIDAINENPESKTLLKRIDDLVRESHWPWLKIVVTCRTEAWKLIRRSVALSENQYYSAKSSQDTEADQLAIELQGFSFSSEIPIFDRTNELPTVYEKYAVKFGIRTPFSVLSPETKQSLQDPLVLRLLMTQFRNGELPHHIDVDSIVQEYIDFLLAQGQIDLVDLHFILNELMPLMINDATLINKVPSKLVGSHVTSDGRRLFDLVYDDTILSNGQRINRSFERLVFSEILAPPSPTSAHLYEIAFKYERFYDYFAGTRLETFLAERTHNPADYDDILSNLQHAPFLWGAVATVLDNRLSQKKLEMVMGLTHTENRAQRQAIGAALVRYGSKGTRQAQEVEAVLIRTLEDKSRSQQFLNTYRIAPAVGARQQAVEIATSLKLSHALILAGTHSNAVVRSVAVRSIERIWRNDRALGEAILVKLARTCGDRVLGITIPDRNVLDTLVSSATLIFVLNYEQADAVRPLSQVLREAANCLLPLNLDTRAGKLLARLLYRGLLFNIGFRLLSDIPDDEPQYIPANLEEISAYFYLPETEKNIIFDILPLFYEESGPLSNRVDVLYDAVKLNDGSVNWAVVHMLARRGISDPLDTVEVIESLFALQIHRERPSYQAAFLIGAYSNLLKNAALGEKELTGLFERFENLVKNYVAETKCRVYYKRAYITVPLEGYFEASYALFRKVNDEFVRDLIQDAIANNDWDLFKAYMRALRSMGVQTPIPVLRVLAHFLANPDPRIVPELGSVLVRIRGVFSDLVDEYLSINGISSSLESYLRVSGHSEEMGDLYQSGLTSWLLDAVANDRLRDAMVLLLGQMPVSSSEKQWYLTLFGYLVNLAFQERLIDLTIQPVNVGHKILLNPWT